MSPAERRHRRYRALCGRLAESLRQTEYAHKALSVQDCHTVFHRLECRPAKHHWGLPAKPCNLRLCPFESRARSGRAVRKWGPVIEGVTEGRHLVLACRNSEKGSLKGGIAALWKAFGCLRKMAVFVGVTGVLASLEVTFNQKAQSWHPHLHCVVQGPYMPYELMLAAWKAATDGAGQTVWISKIDRGTVRELLKYVTKISSFARDPQAVQEFLAVTHRMRFLRSYGVFYRLNAPVDAALTCPDCGSTQVIYMAGLVLLVALVWDHNGILRLRSP